MSDKLTCSKRDRAGWKYQGAARGASLPDTEEEELVLASRQDALERVSALSREELAFL